MSPRSIGTVAFLTVIALTAGACSKSSDTLSLTNDDTPVNGDAVPTTVVRRGPLPSTTTTTTAPTRTATTAEATLTTMLSQIAANPALLNGLAGLGDVDLAELFGVDVAALEQAAIDATGLQDLGALLVGAPQVDLQALVLSQLDPAVIARLQQLTSQIDAAALAAVDGLNQQLIQAVASIVAQIDPATLNGLTALLGEVDPNGLGMLGADPAVASVLAVFAASILESNPVAAQAAHQQVAADPRLVAVLGHLDTIGSLLDPATSAEVVRVGLRATPEALVSLTRLVTLLNDAEVQALLAQLNVSPGQLGLPG